ncbi:VWA domain-containing protein [Pseudactinotalea terrae]|uniref:VWA domain-containing protein n=1 Tax=Pseudactinotalea terrae TaxID=1743262 RepID=UPI0012E15CAD|nr:VWA domain-containing protein [Pseudactinotalea terrae]
MADFTAEVFQNQFLAEGATDVHAIARITATNAGAATAGSLEAAEVIMIDTSGSMAGASFAAAQEAAKVALDVINDGTWFAIVGGSHVANRVFPYPNAPSAMVRMEPAARAEAKRAISMMRAGGGTAMSTWLQLAGQLFTTVPRGARRHAILLTDGKNESEPKSQLTSTLTHLQGQFRCDARGVGSRYVVAEVREIASALMGSDELIRDPSQIAASFQAMLGESMARGVADAELRVWTPQGSELLYVKQVSPKLDDLTPRKHVVNPLTAGFPTGAWGDESREYHVAVRVGSKPVGAEQLAARVQIVTNGEVQASGLVKAMWSSDSSLTARINPEVAHYTGQAELADAIQQGLAAKAAGDEATATVKLGRAVQLAKETGNDEATSRLRRVVEIENEERGTVRLKRHTDKLDEMALDTASTKTTRIRK